MKRTMKVSEEWNGHANDLDRIATMLKSRPTMRLDDHLEALEDLARDIRKEAAQYAAEAE